MMQTVSDFKNDKFVIYTLYNKEGKPVAIIPAKILDQVFSFWISLTDEQRKHHYIDQKVYTMDDTLPDDLDDLFQQNLLELLA